MTGLPEASSAIEAQLPTLPGLSTVVIVSPFFVFNPTTFTPPAKRSLGALPSPSWPKALSPSQPTLRSMVMPQLWLPPRSPPPGSTFETGPLQARSLQTPRGVSLSTAPPPSPSCPSLSLPQHFTVLPGSGAHEWLPPAPTKMAPVRFETQAAAAHTVLRPPESTPALSPPSCP